MADFIRRLVSLDKARYKDDELDIDLDLVYISDRIIVMGYPASGLEAFYRNRREDAKRFLDHRHGKNFWVFNFCPVAENSYPESVFDGRVSRYPFPDHHAPPLAILALVAREIRAWLEPSEERVAVLHCKAGKGRSGTMACAYLLTSDESPSPRTTQQSQTAKDEAQVRAQEIMDAMPADDASQEETPPTEPETPVPLDIIGNSTDTNSGPQGHTVVPDHAEHLSRVLDLHTSKRMKSPASPSEKTKQGVSIPSQRRWLYYWSLALAHQAPPGFWPAQEPEGLVPKVRLSAMTLRMRALSGVKAHLVRAANALLERTSYARAPQGDGRVWASLARYDDTLVGALERWERRTRDGGGYMGRRRPGSEQDGEAVLEDVFKDGRWDKEKMVRPFARLGVVRDEDYRKEETEMENDVGGKIVTRVLRPLTELPEKIREHTEQGGEEQTEDALGGSGVKHDHVPSEATSVSQALIDDQGVVLDANREVRVKLYIGQVFLGWFWFIPAFHMDPAQSTTLVLTRKELDFPVGLGANIIDVAITLDWVSEKALDPPLREASCQGFGEPEPGTLSAVVQAAGDPVAGVVAKQAVQD